MTLLAAAVCLSVPRCSRAADAPNVLIVLTDDQGYGDLGCHGNPAISTPTLDKLFSESTRLTQFCATPVCTPTRASLLTGRYAYRTRAFDTLDGRATMDGDEITMAELFSAAGYQTAIFGKWHLGDNYPARSIDQGFQESLVIRGGGIAHYSDWPGNTYSDPTLVHNGAPAKYEGYCTDIFTDALIKYIKDHRSDRMFLYFATNIPHDPLQVPDKYVEPFKGKGLGEETPRIYGMIKNFDDNLARVFAKMDELQLSDKTIVLFMSDNGPAMQLSEHDLRYNGNLRGEKKQVYEGGIRVPCFVRWPGKLKAGQEIDRVASVVDILPTLANACGVPLPPDSVKLDGKSLLPLLTGAQTPNDWSDRTIHFQWHRGNQPEPFRNAASRTQQYKLVEGRELYDLQSDPTESTNIATQHPEVVARLRSEYEAWLADVSSTRGFEPTLIELGTAHENPTVLNPNDWRRDDPNSKLFNGYWPVRIASSGKYEFKLRTHDHGMPAQLHVRVGSLQRTVELKSGQTEVVFEPFELVEGATRIEGWVQEPGAPDKGMRMITVRRL